MEIVERQVAAPSGETRGPELFLVHGAWRNASVWKALAERLAAAGRKSTAISLPGRGTSTMHKGEIGHYTVQDGMRLVAAELSRFAEPPVLVVHDVSCALALRVAAERPLAGLVMLSPPPAGGLKGLFAKLALRRPLWAVAEFSRGFERPWRDQPDLARKIFLGQASKSEAPPEFEPESKSVIGEFFFSLPATLVPLDAPALVLAGSDSPFSAQATGRLSKKLGAQFETIDGAALDLLHAGVFERTCQAIDGFLE